MLENLSRVTASPLLEIRPGNSLPITVGRVDPFRKLSHNESLLLCYVRNMIVCVYVLTDYRLLWTFNVAIPAIAPMEALDCGHQHTRAISHIRGRWANRVAQPR